MATQILRTDHLVRVARPTDNSTSKEKGGNIVLLSEDGNVFCGFLFAMLIDLILAVLGAGTWELWRHTR